MRNRITWQNVTAPDFSDALQGTRLAGSLLNNAFDKAAGIAGDLREGQMDRASSSAITQALGITDPAEFARAVSTGQFGDSRNFNDEALAFFQGQRGSLLDDQATIADTTRTNALTERTQYDLNRDRTRDPVLDAQSDWRFNFSKEGDIYDRDRSRANDQSADARAAMQSQVSTTVNQLMDTKNMSRDELGLEIANMAREQGWTPEQEDYAYQVLEEKHENQFGVDPSRELRLVANPDLSFGEINRGLESQNDRLNMARSADLGVRLYEDAKENYAGLSDPLDKLLKDTYGDEVESESMWQTRGKVRGIFDRLLDKHSHLTPEIVTQALANSKSKGGYFGLGSSEAFDEGKADELLKQITTEEALNRVIGRSNDFSAQEDQIEAYTSEYESILKKAARAGQRNDDKDQQKHKEAADRLLQEFAAAFPSETEKVEEETSDSPARVVEESSGEDLISRAVTGGSPSTSNRISQRERNENLSVIGGSTEFGDDRRRGSTGAQAPNPQTTLTQGQVEQARAAGVPLDFMRSPEVARIVADSGIPLEEIWDKLSPEAKSRFLVNEFAPSNNSSVRKNR